MTEIALGDLFGAYDIRGIVGKNLYSSAARKIAYAYGYSLSPNNPGKFLIGHDCRLSSAALAESFSIGLREAGHRVVHLGQATTPMIYWCGAEGQFTGSVCVTASHLPPEHNGFKLCKEDAIPLSGEDGLPNIIQAIEKNCISKLIGQESIQRISLISHYAASLKSFFHLKRPLKVVVDAGNGVGGLDTETLFDQVDGIQIWKQSFHPDGMFPERSPNPLETGALDRLGKMVVEHQCDFGLAFDGDADRAVAVDEKGKMIPPDILGGIIALHFLKSHPESTILYDLRATRAFPEAIQKAGGNPLRCRVGHAFVKKTMRENKAAFAAELSGHYYYADLHYTDNGLRTLIELCNVVSELKIPLSEAIKPLQTYATSGEINRPVKEAQSLLQFLEKNYHEGIISHLDGLSVDYSDWWFNVRASNTEPVVRINIGASNSSLMMDKQKKLLKQIEDFEPKK